MEKKIKILHVFPNEKFTNGYIEFINNNFSKDAHEFYVYNKYEDMTLIEDTNVILYNEWTLHNINVLLNKIKNVDKVIFHSLFLKINVILLLFKKSRDMKKYNIVFWGADLYSFKYRERGIKKKIGRFIRKIFIINVGCAITLVDEDYDVLEKYVGYKGKHKLGKYPFTKEVIDDLETMRKEKFAKQIFEEKAIIIMIGNSATETNNHIDVFNIIKKYKNENIKIYVPLSYGNETYKQKVIENGRKFFDDKFIPLLEFMSAKKYCEFISEVDIAIFNNNRQQALNNIYIASFLGAKVYIRKDTSMWGFFQEDKFFLHDLNEILGMKFKDFKELNEDERLSNYKAWKEKNGIETAINIWKKIFEY